MANNFLFNGASLSDATLTTIFTTTNKKVIIGLLCSNTGSASINVSVKIDPDGTGSSERFLVKSAAIPQNSSLEVISGKVVLPASGKIKAQSSSSSGDCDVNVSSMDDVS